MPFLLYLALRSSGYLAAILMGLAVSAWLLREFAESEPLIERGGIIFSLVLSLGFNLLFGVNGLLGQGVFVELRRWPLSPAPRRGARAAFH